MDQQRATTWSLTIANPTEKAEEEISLARQKGWVVTGQKEQGAGGLVHYQLCLKTPQVRFSAVKKAFGTAHIEIARNPAALAIYVGKEETRVAGLAEESAMYPSLSKFWELIYEYMNVKNYLDHTEERFEWWKDAPRVKGCPVDPLVILDEATADLIERGFHVEGIAVNPSTRSGFKRYALSLMFRARASINLRQTDRQTDTDALESRVEIPVSIE